MTSLDAWTYARLLSNQPVNGNEIGAVSGPFMPFAERLAGLPIDRRSDAWQGFLDGRNGDRDTIRQAVTDANPTGPQPEPTEAEDDQDEADGWGPIRYSSVPQVEQFPLDVLPLAVRRLVTEGAESIGCPPDFVAVAALAVAAGVIGRSCSLRIKPGYFASSSLFAACIGPPSDGKSPAIGTTCSAIRRIDETLQINHDNAMVRWKEGQDTDKKATLTAPPKPQRIDLDDTTMEALPLILADNPRGLILIKDELAGLMLSLGQFKGGKGSDRQTLLSVWSGSRIKIDRVRHEANIPVRCPHPCLTIVGAMTPDMLGTLADAQGRADGFLDRFLLTAPPPRPISRWSDRGIDEGTTDYWSALVARLWERPMNVKDGRSVSHVAYLDGIAKEAWETFFNDHAAEMNAADFSPKLRGPWGKLGEYAGRLVLVLACLDHAADPTSDPGVAPIVSAQLVADAWKLIGYFKSHARKVHALMGGKLADGGGDVGVLLGWIARNGLTEFSIRDVDRNFDRFKDDPAALADALTWMTAHNIVRLQPDPETRISKRGRKRSPRYLINLALWKSPRFRQFRQNPTDPGNKVGKVGNADESEGKR